MSPILIDQIRHASRNLVRELGFMRSTLANSGLPPSAVHALIEIDLRPPVTAARLTKLLNLEKSSVSRMLAKLVAAGEIAERVGGDDGREKRLTLTDSGKRTVAALNAFAVAQVSEALRHIPAALHENLVMGLEVYGQALALVRSGAPANLPANGVTIERGYRPGAIGRVVHLHAEYYSRMMGFDAYFEGKVASELADFVSRLDNPANGLWLAVQEERIVGSVAIDIKSDRTAHLRWFILAEAARGQGVGGRLLARAVEHCDALEVETTTLWTIKGLDAARHLYETTGFQLVDELHAAQWGKHVIEQKYARRRARETVRLG